jgi:hypothetical protein
MYLSDGSKALRQRFNVVFRNNAMTKLERKRGVTTNASPSSWSYIDAGGAYKLAAPSSGMGSSWQHRENTFEEIWKGERRKSDDFCGKRSYFRMLRQLRMDGSTATCGNSKPPST